MNRSVIFRLVAVTLLLLIVVELSGRFIFGLGDPPLAMLDSEVEYYLVPSSEYQRFGNRISINSLSMRSVEFEKDAASDECRVYVLGDSVVYGNHHIDQKETIVYRLHELLESNQPTIGALASSSWGPGNIDAFIDKFGPFPGKAAVLVQSSHDTSDVPFNGLDITPYQLQKKYGAIHDGLTAVWQKVEHTVFPPQTSMSYEQKVESASASLSTLIQKLKMQYPIVLLIYHPTVNETQQTDVDQSRFFASMATEYDIDFIDLRSNYRAAYKNKIPVHLDTIHLSPEGALIISQVIAKYLQEKRAC